MLSVSVNILEPIIECELNPFLLTDRETPSYASIDKVKAVKIFHQSLPGYLATPLVNLEELASRFGIDALLVKDESQRFDLKAFKVLGASYAIAKEIKKQLGLNDEELNFDAITAHKSAFESLTFVTATDGNHGRAVAWCAEKFGCKAVVFMPKGTSKFRLQAIQSHGAKAEITELNYDETVLFSAQKAKENNWVLLQDSSWERYKTVPKYIMQGYFSLGSEFEDQTETWPTHVLAQAGVGSFAASIFSYFLASQKPTPKLILVEPTGAACFFNSIQIGDGKPHLTKELNTMMAGLSCGQPSMLAWDIIKPNCDAFVICNDQLAKKGMQLLANPIANDAFVVSGESGAVPIGLVNEICTNQKYSLVKEKLKFDGNSKILIFSTEGDTDPTVYKKHTKL
jgi:diaminopropionate ammonia-lyase